MLLLRAIKMKQVHSSDNYDYWLLNTCYAVTRAVMCCKQHASVLSSVVASAALGANSNQYNDSRCTGNTL